MALPVNEYLTAIIIIQLSIKLPLLGGIKRGTANMRVPVSGTRFPEELEKSNVRMSRVMMDIHSGIEVIALSF